VSRFLFTTLTSDDLGLLARTLPIACQLAARGHDVAYCNQAPAPRALIEGEAHLDNLALSPGLLPRTFAPPTPEVWNMDHFWALVGCGDADYVLAAVQSMATLMEEFQPDAVVDSWNITACLAARITRRPLVTILQGDMHPANDGFIWWREPPRDVPSALAAVNATLRHYGLSEARKSEDLMVGGLTLIAGTPVTDPVPYGTDAVYIGPVLWQKHDAELPDWAARLGRTRPLVWVYSGNPSYGIVTWADSVAIIRSCVAALADEDLDVVLTTGHHDLPGGTAALPRNFRFEAYLPGQLMAQKSALLVHHGGHGSCMTGLVAGTPAVIIPTYSERESNARRVAALGAGKVVLPSTTDTGEKNVSADAVRAAVVHVLSEPAFLANARRVAASMSAYGGASEAAALIEAFAAAGR